MLHVILQKKIKITEISFFFFMSQSLIDIVIKRDQFETCLNMLLLRKICNQKSVAYVICHQILPRTNDLSYSINFTALYSALYVNMRLNCLLFKNKWIIIWKKVYSSIQYNWKLYLHLLWPTLNNTNFLWVLLNPQQWQ